jgi:hypothetical protein
LGDKQIATAALPAARQSLHGECSNPAGRKFAAQHVSGESYFGEMSVVWLWPSLIGLSRVVQPETILRWQGFTFDRRSDKLFLT